MKKISILLCAVLLSACAEYKVNKSNLTDADMDRADKIAAQMLENARTGKAPTYKQPSVTITDKNGNVKHYATYDEYARAEGKYNMNPVYNAILFSDLEAFNANIDSVTDESVLGGYLRHAVGICDPYRTRKPNEQAAAVCNKENNVEIIRILLEKGADPNRIHFKRTEANSNYAAVTLAYELKEWNPAALKYILPKMDKCLAAATQMQGADPSKPNYYVYADYWRNNNCSFENYKTMRTGLVKDQEFQAILGKDKEAVFKKMGKNPTVYEHPSEHREVLTYKKVETREGGGCTVGAKGCWKTFYTEEYHYVFTLDRGVVTKIQQLHISTTNGRGEKTVYNQEELLKKEQEKKEKQKGHVLDRRGIIKF